MSNLSKKLHLRTLPQEPQATAGTSTVVCTVTTRHRCNVEQQRMSSTRPENCIGRGTCKKIQLQPSTNSEDCRRRGQGRRSNVTNRLTTAGLRLPRQPVTASGDTTPGFSGPFPLHSGVFGPPPLFILTAVHAGSRVLLSGGSLGLSSLLVVSPGVLSQPPWSFGRFSGRRPCARSAIARDR